MEKERWNLVKDSELDLMPSLTWSYNNLPSEVKPCFQYCSLIPKGHAFHKKDLILKWMALDLMDHTESFNLEDIGSKNFDVLLQMSFFGKVDDRYYYMYY